MYTKKSSPEKIGVNCLCCGKELTDFEFFISPRCASCNILLKSMPRYSGYELIKGCMIKNSDIVFVFLTDQWPPRKDFLWMANVGTDYATLIHAIAKKIVAVNPDQWYYRKIF